MTYQLIPQPNDLLSNSQGDILNNFTVANTSFGINHYSFTDVSGASGKHKFVEMPINTPPTTIVGEGAVYTSSSATGSPPTPQLIYRKENQSGAYASDSKDIPLSLLAPRVMLVYNVGTGSIVGYNYNVTSVVFVSAGIFTINFPALASVNYIPFISLGVNEVSTSDNLWTCRVNYNTITTSSCQIVFTRRASGSNALVNPDFFSFSIYGGFV